MRAPTVLAFLSLLVSLPAAANDGAWTYDPAAPPTIVRALPALGLGAQRLRFPGLPRQVDALGAAIVELRPDAVVPTALREQGRPLGRSERTWLVAATAGEGALSVCARWAADSAVASVTPDLLLPKRTSAVDLDDPRLASQWYHDELGTRALWEVTLGSPTTRVAVIDSGIDISHPDLAAGIADPYDAFDDDDDPSPNPGDFCGGGFGVCDEHGTAVSGIIGARANNGIGIVGFCPECTLVPIRMLGEGNGALSADIKAFEHAIDADAAVINNSWGYTEPMPVPAALANVIHRAATEPRGGLGAVVVFAAGNDDRDLGNNELEALEDVLCVSATDRYGNPTAYTNRGDAVDLAASSATMTTSVNGGYTETFGGTSAAAPVVSGVAGWILSAKPELSAAEVRALFRDTVQPSPLVTPDADGHHPIYGYGNLSLDNLLAELYPPAEETGGCGCQSAPTPSLAWAALLLVPWWRRRE